jgi:REP element-mobilizing transposase RayT
VPSTGRLRWPAMPRQPRHLLGDGTFHITARGVARTVIYRERDDFRAFLGLLTGAVERFTWKLHAFCLMPNHYHLVLEASRRMLSKGMHRLNGLYADGFNDRYERAGHLFQNRFGARKIEDDDYLADACCYVLENPVRAGLCATPAEWPWSGGDFDYSAAAGVRSLAASAHADTSAHTPSSSRKPHCSSYQVRIASAVAPTRFNPMYQYERWLSTPNCVSA